MRLFTLTLAIFVLLPGAFPRSGHAQWIVSDPGNFAQNLLTAAHTATQIEKLVDQINNQKDQIDKQRQTLQSIDPTSFNGIKQLVNQSQITYQMLQSDLTTIGYDVNRLNKNFTTLFPKDQTQWKNVPAGAYDAHYNAWNSEITASALAAARAQTSISTLDKNNQAIATILVSANSSNTGEVRQLQLVNQQLALIHTELVSLVQNLGTMARVVSDLAAADVGEKMLNREASRQRMLNYTSRGAPPKRLNRLP